MNRRDLLIAGGALAVAPTLAHAAPAEKLVDYLFVQASEKVRLADNVLRLQTVNPHTIFFSDRPERIVGKVDTEKFVGAWSKGTDSFKSDPPNAVLTNLDHANPVALAVVLRNPRLEGGDLIYDVEVLDGPKTLDVGPSSVFIDVIGLPATPLSFAGVARRTARRTARRVYRRRW